jgi:hypothetical protein
MALNIKYFSFCDTYYAYSMFALFIFSIQCILEITMVRKRHDATCFQMLINHLRRTIESTKLWDIKMFLRKPIK